MSLRRVLSVFPCMHIESECAGGGHIRRLVCIEPGVPHGSQVDRSGSKHVLPAAAHRLLGIDMRTSACGWIQYRPVDLLKWIFLFDHPPCNYQ